MSFRPSLPALLAILAVLALPSPAAASSGGGAVAVPDSSGGSAYGTPVPSSLSAEERRLAEERAARRAARREAAKRRAAKRRAAKRRAAKRRAARRRAARRRSARRPAARSPRPPAPAPAPGYVFPVAGPYSLGGSGSEFGAPRSGHRHMGHDLSAASGTPVLAPYAGVVSWVRFQREGAGHYVVLDGDDGHDYVFMHLKRGSIPVVAGQRLAAGDQLGQVGNSGRSFGAHLHFEVWTGGWYEKGGEPIDPLPLLLAWGATR